ncbi:Trk system potassium transporter TrkA [Spirochaetes bacterium]|uniref:Trk system potassium uptake protein TrkA n=1 Tax=Candidatus Scatousia excrementipullorum TaxID=2840936 RepID=A0A9D9DQ25_9BACT|nr:Trk system potassium transporter TrkA [Candidatus Scatousia excrementipullorum]
MKIIIFGATEIGCLLATEFFEDHDITIIDKEENKTDEFNKLDISFVGGNVCDVSVLKEADIQNADVFIACTAIDEANIVACLTAKKIGGIRTICFISKEEYRNTLCFEKNNMNCGDFFIDYIIWPEELLMQDIFRIVTVAEALDVENFADGKARLMEYKVKPNLSIVGKKVKDCNFTQDTLIVGITRNSELFIPNGETEILPDDKIIFMGTSHSLDILAGTFFHEKEIVKNAAIIGGGTVGLMLAQNLEMLKIKTKIIEKSYDRCQYISQYLKNTLIINGDGTNLKLLDEEEIGSADVVISVTNNDEKNLLCSLLSKQLGVKRVVARVAKVLNIPLFEKVGIDVAVSPKNSAISEVKNDLAENDVDILATVEQGLGEVLEIKVSPEFHNKKIMELKFPSPAIVGTIQRRGQVIIPYGLTELKAGDTMIIFTTAEDAGTIKEFFNVGDVV